jgi:hypothetical protein
VVDPVVGLGAVGLEAWVLGAVGLEAWVLGAVGLKGCAGLSTCDR